MAPVVVRVVLAGFFRMMRGVDGMTVGYVSVMTGFLVVSALVVIGCRAVMLGGVLMMFGCFPVMVGFLFRHGVPLEKLRVALRGAASLGGRIAGEDHEDITIA